VPGDTPAPVPGDASAPEAASADPDFADPPEEDAPCDRTSDLYRLPGAGSGLVWMLGQSGIESLESLARADVARLETSLGLVGQLLDVAGWVAFAQRQTDTPENLDQQA
jgi:predicted flap endonuclease-1-like 5' DNA nuclease